MRVSLHLSFLFFSLLVALAAHGELFGVTNDPGWPVERIDPDTGNVSRVANTNEPGPWATTIDPIGKRYFTFVGGAGGQKLTITDLSTGNVATRTIAYAETFYVPEYDVFTQKIFAVSSSFAVISIDPSTGGVTPLFSVAPFSLTGYTLYNHAIDPYGRRLFILSNDVPGSATLNVIDLAHANASSFPETWAGGGFALGMQFDSAGDQLLIALGAAQSPLLAINSRTGAAASLLLMTVPGGAYGLTAFDQSRRQFFFLSGADFSRLVIVDIGSAAVRVVATPTFAGGLVLWNYLSATPVPVDGAAVLLLLACGLVVVAVIRIA